VFLDFGQNRGATILPVVMKPEVEDYNINWREEKIEPPKYEREEMIFVVCLNMVPFREDKEKCLYHLNKL